MINLPALYRTFLIQSGDGQGTAFAVDLDGRQYLITAKHVVREIQAGSEVQIFGKKHVNVHRVEKVVMPPHRGSDVIALVLSVQVAAGHQPTPTQQDLILSQQVYFLGYPFGKQPQIKLPDNPDFPIPFVKSGVVSAFEQSDERGPTFFIDGQANPGFSGGPVVFVHQNMRRIAGVVYGQITTKEPVLNLDGSDTGLSMPSDAGLILAFTIDPIIKVLQADPCGFLLPAGDHG